MAELDSGVPPAVPTRLVTTWIGLLAGLAAVVGALGGALWSMVVDLPGYEIQPDGAALIGEEGLARIAFSDVWFVTIGAVIGLGLGFVVWRWFRALGWPVALLAIGAGLVAGLVAWWFGELLGPGSFADRVSAAQPGDVVPVALQLRSWSALWVWAMAALVPVMLGSTFASDPEGQPAPRRRDLKKADETPDGVVDERGVLTEPGDPSK